mmetsp:Transcript_69295/g.196365  ORF Transcript_69295/g.196365 Transcript_69295/m.196365 type:complete len:185 (+) Transcript_69295:61-615(+)
MTAGPAAPVSTAPKRLLDATEREYGEALEPPLKAARADPSATLESLLKVRPAGPPDFGGRLAELLWGVHYDHSATIEYLLLSFPMSSEQRKEGIIGARRVERPELHSLLRCNRSVRLGTIAAARARDRTIEPSAPPDHRTIIRDMCMSLRQKYPASWAATKGCCASQDWEWDSRDQHNAALSVA